MHAMAAWHDKVLSESLLVLNDNDRPETFAARLQAAIHVLLGTELIDIECFDRVATWTGRLLEYPAGPVSQHFAAFLRSAATHPLFPAFLSGRLSREPVRLSDVISDPALHRLEIFQTFLKPIGVDRQIAIALPRSDGTDVLILSRKGTDFSASERDQLQLFLPHVGLAQKRAIALRNGLTPPSQAPQDGADTQDRLQRLRNKFGLTLREAEIVSWLTKGKADKDLADICGISHRTVQKHCENIYRKMGVDGRTGTVIHALEQS
jgi:DNA-binding CsgD family transcriptional regulator